MPRKKLDSAERLEHRIAGLFNAQERATIERTAKHYGVSVSFLVRHYVRRGMEHPDPFTPTKSSE